MKIFRYFRRHCTVPLPLILVATLSVTNWWFMSAMTTAPLKIPIMELSEVEELANTGSGAIFFVETNENRTELAHVPSCALESAARHNRNAGRTVFLLLGLESRMEMSPSWLTREGVIVAKINMTEVFLGTPLQELWTSGKVDSGPFFVKDRSNFERIGLVHRFGGTFMDTDIISLAPLPQDQMPNMVSTQGPCDVNPAFFALTKGHPFLDKIILELSRTFNAYLKNNHGPFLWIRVMERECNVVMDETNKKCFFFDCNHEGFNMLPVKATHPIRNPHYSHLFNKTGGFVTAASTAPLFPGSFAIHTWNSAMRRDRHVAVLAEDTLYFQMALRNCPSTTDQMLRPMLGKDMTFEMEAGIGTNKDTEMSDQLRASLKKLSQQ